MRLQVSSEYDEQPTFLDVKARDGRQIAKFSVEDWETLLADPLRWSALQLADRIPLLARLRRRRKRDDEAHQLLELGVVRPALQRIAGGQDLDGTLLARLLDKLTGRRGASFDGLAKFYAPPGACDAYAVRSGAGARNQHWWRPEDGLRAMCGEPLGHVLRIFDRTSMERCGCPWRSHVELRAGVEAEARRAARKVIDVALNARLADELPVTAKDLDAIADDAQAEAAAAAVIRWARRDEEGTLHRLLGPTEYPRLRARTANQPLAPLVPDEIWQRRRSIDHNGFLAFRKELTASVETAARAQDPSNGRSFSGRAGRPSWQEHYAAAQAYVASHGTLPPRSYETSDGIRVGAWLHNQRMSLRGHRPIAADRVEQLKRLHPNLRELAAR